MGLTIYIPEIQSTSQIFQWHCANPRKLTRDVMQTPTTFLNEKSDLLYGQHIHDIFRNK